MPLVSFQGAKPLGANLKGSRIAVITHSFVPNWQDFRRFCEVESKEGLLVTGCDWDPPSGNGHLRILGVTSVCKSSNQAGFNAWVANHGAPWARGVVSGTPNRRVGRPPVANWLGNTTDGTRVEQGWWLFEQSGKPPLQEDLDWVCAEQHPHVYCQSKKSMHFRERLDRSDLHSRFQRSDDKHMISGAPGFVSMADVIEEIAPGLQSGYSQYVGP